MKIFIATLFLLCSYCVSGQNIKVETLNEGDEVIVKATNDDDVDYFLEFVLETKGYGLKSSHTIDLNIPRKSTVEVGRYMARKKAKKHSFKLEYSTSLKISNEEGQQSLKAKNVDKVSNENGNSFNEEDVSDIEEDIIQPEGIVVYSNEGCGRCEMTVKYLTENKIPFTELDTEIAENNGKMADAIFNNGFEGGRFMMPVIVIGDEVHYDIKDLTSFLASLK